MKEEIEQWLKSQKDYETGLALFEKYAHKRAQAKFLRRKRRPDVLEYQLGKLTGTVSIPVVGLDAKQTKQTVTPEEKPAESKKERLVVLDHRVRYEDLPEDLKLLYDQNRTLYKKMRALHEKMKIAGNDQERAKLRKELVEYDEVVSENWKRLDSIEELEGDKVPLVEWTEEEKAKHIGTCRKFLSVNLKAIKEMKGVKRQKMVFKLTERVRMLKDLGATVSEATKMELKKHGIYI